MDTCEPVLRDRYEIIVIGTGIAGLSAAAILAHEGLEVLLVEQSDRPGGFCSSFRRGDFTFDCAASIIQGFGEVGFHVQRTLFDFFNQQVELIPRDIAYTMYLGDIKIDLYRDRHAYTAELGALFPQQAGSILSFIREMEHVYHAVLDCSGPLKPPGDETPMARLNHYLRHPMSILRASRYERMSVERVLGKHVDDPVATAFFDADLFFNTGYGISELSSPVASLAMMDRHVGGMHYPIGSSQHIPDRLEKSIVEHGGRVAYHTTVEEVVVEAGRAVGVRLKGGSTIAADAVVADTAVSELLGGLVRPEHLKEQTLDWVGSLDPGASVMAVYAAIDEKALPEEIGPDTVIVEDARDARSFVAVSIPSFFDPNLAPEGYHCATIHATTNRNLWPRPRDTEYGSAEYSHTKELEAERILEEVEKVIPGFKGWLVDTLVASPATFERYTMRPYGSLAGPRVPDVLLPAALPGAVTEIRGLFLTGDSTFFGRGVGQAAASGINSAQATCRYLGVKPPRFLSDGESYVLETIPVRPQISVDDVVDNISAMLESHRCMRCEDAPCRAACPAGIDIPTVIRRVSATDLAGAAQTLRECNPFGEVCGLVCPAERLCELACKRAETDQAVRIKQIEELVAGSVSGPEGWPSPYPGPRRERVAVIGSGPAGISCAYFLSLLGYSVEMFESSIVAGGLPTHAMPDFRLGRQVVWRTIEGALAAGVEFRGNTVFGDDINFESLSREGFRAVFLGTGLGVVLPLEMNGADLPGVIDALTFLEAARRGVTRELAASVAVLGDGDLALDTALLARELGAGTVSIVTDRPRASMRAAPARLEQAVAAGIQVLDSRRVAEIVGTGRVEGLRTYPTIGSGVSDAPPVTGGVLEVGTVINALKQGAEATLNQYLAGHLRLSESGTIEVDEETCMTSRSGIFAGGDAVSGGGLIVEACARGRKAALAIDKFLRSEPRPRRSSQEGGVSAGS